jgi:hypothetical protein
MLTGEPEEARHLKKFGLRWEDNIKTDHKGIGL